MKSSNLANSRVVVSLSGAATAGAVCVGVDCALAGLPMQNNDATLNNASECLIWELVVLMVCRVLLTWESITRKGARSVPNPSLRRKPTEPQAVRGRYRDRRTGKSTPREEIRYTGSSGRNRLHKRGVVLMQRNAVTIAQEFEGPRNHRGNARFPKKSRDSVLEYLFSTI